MFYTVIQGKQLGRKIGFPTLNLEPAKLSVDFEYGVYACEVVFQKLPKVHQGVLHYGPRKTLAETAVSLEVHLLDFKADVYGEKITLKIKEKIREIQKFANLEDLKQQIVLDIFAVKSV